MLLCSSSSVIVANSLLHISHLTLATSAECFVSTWVLKSLMSVVLNSHVVQLKILMSLCFCLKIGYIHDGYQSGKSFHPSARHVI